jgi:NADH dehydrogenase FAD-containing subunit
MGDSGLLTAIHLAGHADVVGISAKPALVSGQELGMRLARPQDWSKDYWITFDRFRKLDRVHIVHGTLTGLDLAARQVHVRDAQGTDHVEPYDVLVIATGVTNGFWRQPTLQHGADVSAELAQAHERLAAAGSVTVIGGGAAAVSTAFNLATSWPDKKVGLYFPGDRALPAHHPGVWRRVRGRLEAAGVALHPGHRAVVPDGFELDRITAEPVAWSTGQPSTSADAVVWAIGRVRPNTAWLPGELLDDGGFVKVEPDLRVVGAPGVFAVGDVAATDPLRTSARNRADRLVARNIRASLRGGRLRAYKPPGRRWGSVLGFQPHLDVFAPTGQRFRVPGWTVRSILQPWIVRRGIYRGIRRG